MIVGCVEGGRDKTISIALDVVIVAPWLTKMTTNVTRTLLIQIVQYAWKT